MPFLSAIARSGSQCQHTEHTPGSPLPPASKSGASGARSPKLDLVEVADLNAAKDDRHHRGGASIALFTVPRMNHRSPLFCSRRASRSEPLVRRVHRSGGVPPLPCLQPRRGGFRGGPAETTNFASVRRVWPNSSLNHRTRYGGLSWPGLGYAVHSPSPVQAIPPHRAG
jgi:hypothetical protein